MSTTFTKRATIESSGSIPHLLHILQNTLIPADAELVDIDFRGSESIHDRATIWLTYEWADE